jgi:lysophospholipase L1-like esterase
VNAIDDSVRGADPQLHVLNYAGAVTDPEEFADGVHLNERGSVALLQILQRDGVFAIHSAPSR